MGSSIFLHDRATEINSSDGYHAEWPQRKRTLANLSRKNDSSYLITVTPKAGSNTHLVHGKNPVVGHQKGTLTASNHSLSLSGYY